MSKFSSKRSLAGWRVVAGAAALALALAGCSIGSGDASAGTSGSTLEAIKARGVLKVGVGLQTPPFGSTDKSGKPQGFDVDVAQELADYLGVKLEAQDVSADARVPALQSSKYDLISYTFTITPERKQQIDFSDPTMRSYGALAVPKSSPVNSIDDLSGKTIAVQKGSIGATYAAQANPKARLAQYDTQSSAFLAAAQGQADGIVDTAGPLTYEVSQNPSMKVIPGKVGGDVQSFALGVKKGNTTLVEQINAFLKQFHAKGEGKKLYKKWFGFEPTFDFDGLEQ
jgi:polar amino acid transport system substrate-binding protein